MDNSELNVFLDSIKEKLGEENSALISDDLGNLITKNTEYSSTKTLARLGFNSTNYPASRIELLSHYQAFLNANWTIGYE